MAHYLTTVARLDTPTQNKDNSRIWIALVCCFAAALPFLVTKFIPVADLPQQVAQIRLFLEAASGHSPYALDWFAPNRICYAVLGFCWAILPPVHVGRIAMMLLCIAWVVSAHTLAAKRERSAATAALVGALFFNRSLYWGFYSFLLGMPLFLFWITRLEAGDEPPEGRRISPKAVAESLLFFALLYFAHVLWFAAALAWLAIRTLFVRQGLMAITSRAVGALPLVVMALLWYPRMTKMGFASATTWGLMPWERIFSGWAVDASLGGVEGWIEPAYLALLALWVSAGLLQHRSSLREKIDFELLLCAGLFILGALVLPYKHTNTIEFAERWLPVGFTLLPLALPGPSLKRGVEKAVAICVMAGFCLFTSAQWVAIDRNEFSGMNEVLAALPENPSVIGVDLKKTTSLLKLRQPFLQTFAYAQVVRGGSLNFSFADFPNSMVYYSPRRRISWTNGLEWMGEKATERDFRQFQYAIVSGDPLTVHSHPFIRRNLIPITKTGVWRLYKTRQ